MSGRYDDILDLPHHVSATRPQMSMADRAAQFSPFAALTGYDAAIRETGRLTETEVELPEDALDALNQKFRLLTECSGKKQAVDITYFQPDSRKTGGAYATVSGIIKKIDPVDRLILMAHGATIRMAHVVDISLHIPGTTDKSR